MAETRRDTSFLAIFRRTLEAWLIRSPVEAAKLILGWGFADTDKARMKLLSAKARKGTLNEAEQEEIDSYERVVHMLSLMQSKARLSLKKHGEGGGIEPQ